MTLDAHIYCPGGTGKKIKHCACRDIIGDLEKIMRAMEGNQRIAALGHINRVLATKANRPCLLSLKIMNQLDMKDLQSLEETVTTFVKVAPDNALAHTYAALLEVRKHQTKAAVSSVQSAIEHATESFPGELYDAIGAVAEALAGEHKYVAARGHLLFRAMIGNQEEDAMQPLMSISSASGIPTLLKRDFVFAFDGAGTPWARPFEDAAGDLVRGAWRSGLKKLEKLNDEHPGQGPILRNIAMAHSYLGDSQAVRAWHNYAMVESLAFDTAVIAEATSQLLDYEATRKTVGLVKLTLHVTDANALQEKLLSSNVVAASPVDPAELRDEGAPPPKAVFQLLDRPMPASVAELSLDTVPRILGQMLLFGKETDRDARLEVALAKGSQYDHVRASLAEIGGDLLSEGREGEEILDTIPLESVELFATLRFPRETPFEVRKRLADEAASTAFAQRWPELPQAVLDDKTPAQVAGDPAYRIRLAAVLLVLEQVVEIESWPADVNQLRQALGVAVPPPIDPTQTELSGLEPHDWARVVPAKLTDDQLLDMYRQSALFSARQALRLLSVELLGRASLSERLDMAAVCGGMAQLTNDPDEALVDLRRAREYATKAGSSPARWYLAELPLRLLRGEASEARHIMSVLQSRHIREQGVSEGLYNILVRFGVITPDGRLASAGEPAAPETAADPGQKLWTPDAATAPPPGEKRESQLWVPGMD